MTDRDQAQIRAIEIIYPKSWIFLCKWHVLCMMQSHFNIIEFSELWIKVQDLVSTPDQAVYDRLWAEISSDPSFPQPFVDYMRSQWILKPKKWSKVHRKQLSIFEEGDTNMLIEAYVIFRFLDGMLTYDKIRYHHILKSHWLDSKRNRRIDRIIYTLVKHLEPYFQNRHARQTFGFEGLDLAAARRQVIEASARDISLDSVLNFDSTHFHVASQSCPGEFYAIDLVRSTCDCADFPRIRFCKHIAAVYVHFPHLCSEGNNAPTPPESLTAPFQPQNQASHDTTLQALTQDIVMLSQTLASKTIDRSADSSATLEAARSAKYSLTAAIASHQSIRALPEKEIIAPNQKSWPETAERMGAKHGPKRRYSPEERGLTARSIGIAKAKRRTHTDPYASGERSGKCAKPEAMSAAANTRARAPPPSGTASPSNGPIVVPMPPSASAPACGLPASAPHV